MTSPLPVAMFLLIGFCIITEAARELCFKYAADDEDFFTALAKPVTWLGIIFWIAELMAWVVVLEQVPLSYAFPLMSLVYVAIVYLSAWVFKESVTFRHSVGALLITAGVACVGATGI